MRSGPGLNGPGRRDGILSLQAPDDRVAVEIERGKLARREVEIDRFVLRADQIDLAGIRNLEHLGADILDIVAQLAHGQPVAGEGIDIAKHIAELIVERGRQHPLRELVLDVRDHVPDLRPNARDVTAPWWWAGGSRRPWFVRAWCSF